MSIVIQSNEVNVSIHFAMINFYYFHINLSKKFTYDKAIENALHYFKTTLVGPKNMYVHPSAVPPNGQEAGFWFS